MYGLEQLGSLTEKACRDKKGIDAMVFGSFRRQSGSGGGIAPISILDDPGQSTLASGGGFARMKRALSFTRKSHRATYDGAHPLPPQPPPPRALRSSAPGNDPSARSSDDESDDDAGSYDPAFPQGLNRNSQDEEHQAYYEAAQRSSAPAITRVVAVKPRQSQPGSNLPSMGSLASAQELTPDLPMHNSLRPTPPTVHVPAPPAQPDRLAPLSLDSLTLGHMDVISASSSGMTGAPMRATFRLSSDGSSGGAIAGGALSGGGLSASRGLFRDACGRRSLGRGVSKALPDVQDSPQKRAIL